MRPSSREHDRGAAAVEAALIFPVLILLTFGIIEVSLLLRDYVSVNSVVRTGVRTAATLPRDATMFDATVQAINRAGTALPQDTYEQLWIYRPNSAGFPQGSSDFTTCGNDCIIYKADPVTGVFGRSTEDPSKDWNPMDMNACPGDPTADAVGVYLRVKHRSATDFLFRDLRVADHAVSKFEPIATFSGTVPCKKV